jgi:hypothetical protein
MNSMTKDDVVAELALRDLEKREHLMEIIHQPGFQYYTGGSLLGAASALASGALFTWLFLRENVPGWGFVLFMISAIGFLEATRQRSRFNALLELHELEKDKANKPCVATGDNVPI